MVHHYRAKFRLPKTEAEWLKARLAGIGASEASAVIGCNPYMSNIDLWRIKTGRKAAEDISGKAFVRYGHEAERPLRELFALDYPEYRVSYGGAFDMVRNPDYPYLFATLDGRLEQQELAEDGETCRRTGRFGVLEIKTTNVLQSMQREKWNDAIPQNYYIQVLHQLLCTGFDFAVLTAQLKRVYGTEVRCEVRRYLIDRADKEDDINWLLEQELKFWEYVQADKEPPLVLPEL